MVIHLHVGCNEQNKQNKTCRQHFDGCQMGGINNYEWILDLIG